MSISVLLWSMSATILYTITNAMLLTFTNYTETTRVIISLIVGTILAIPSSYYTIKLVDKIFKDKDIK